LPNDFHSQEDICLDNGNTNEKLMAKMEESTGPYSDGYPDKEDEVVLLISRYPLDSTKRWIDENEKEVLEWNFFELSRTVYLSHHLEIGAM
jgi:hypothetical protein